MSRLQDDLKKIVGIDKIEKKLADIVDNSPIESKRGVAYQNGASGQVETLSGPGGSGGVTAPSDALGSGLAATRLAATDAAKAALAGLSGANGFETGRTPAKQDTDGVLDLTDIIDGWADSTLAGGDSFSFGPNLSGISGWTDCTSGEDGVVRLDSYIPPIGWPDSSEPYLDPTWQLSYYWGDGGSWATPSEGAQARIDALNGFSGGSPLYTYQNMRVASLDGFGAPDQYDYDIYEDGVFNATAGSVRQACAGSGAPYCSTEAPTVPWDLPYFQVLFNSNTGLYETNSYDPKAPEIYNEPSGSVYMCFDSGRTATLTAGAGDTKLLYETDPTTGAPLAGSYLHIYDSKGQVKGYADSALLNQYTP